MKVIPLEKTALTLPEAAEMARADLVILTRKGKPLAAIKHLSKDEWEALALSNSPEFQALLAEARRSFQEEGGIRLEDLRQELDLPAKPRNRSRKKKNQPPGRASDSRPDNTTD
jgi:hypothetical protein